MGLLRVSTRTGSSLALILAALTAIGEPAHAQDVVVVQDERPKLSDEPLPDGREQTVLLPAESDALPIAPDAAAVEVPDEIIYSPDPLAEPDGQADDPSVIAPIPVVANLDPDDVATPGDPLERTNRRFFKTQSGIDRRVFRPVSQFYKRAVPKPARSALRNIIRNLTEPIVFVNDLLQLRPGRAVRTLGRFVINSTVGLGGAIDVAKTADLPYRSNGFGNTLGRYGVGPGPYLYLPLIGPTTLRDLLGGQIDAFTLPVTVGFPFDRLDYQLSRGVVSTLDKRVEVDDELNALLSGAADPYATLRSVYLQSRAAEIADVRGQPFDLAPLDDPLTDPADPAADPIAGSVGDTPEHATMGDAAMPTPDTGSGAADAVETTPDDMAAPPSASPPMEAAADR